MALRTAQENKVIGSQTAGADGNVTVIALPDGVRTVFTGLGVYYPDGTATQRIWIVPDIETRATLAGLRAGLDEGARAGPGIPPHRSLTDSHRPPCRRHGRRRDSVGQ
jgi:C-terminal processing protease CtpA/Prc